jgi:hypothetical protein
LADKQLYRKEIPPFESIGEKAKIIVNFTILQIGSVEEIEQLFTVRFLILLKW